MPSFNLFTSQCFTGKQSIGCPLEEQAGYWVENLLFKGDQPLVCTYHIYLEKEAKPVRQLQRRLNPHMQEVVRVEVLKLLQADIIYPISDST